MIKNETIKNNKNTEDISIINTPIKGIWGLTNSWNRSYMNSVLQMLWHMPPFKNYFLGVEYVNDKDQYKLNSCVSEKLNVIMQNLWKGSQNSFDPKSFTSEARKFIQLLDSNINQDCWDFLYQLLKIIDSELTG